MTPGTLANPGAAGAGFLSRLGNGLGLVGEAKQNKPYQTNLTYMKSYQGKSIIMTGATGGIGSKVAKRLMKAGMYISYFTSYGFRGENRYVGLGSHKGGNSIEDEGLEI